MRRVLSLKYWALTLFDLSLLLWVFGPFVFGIGDSMSGADYRCEKWPANRGSLFAPTYAVGCAVGEWLNAPIK